MQNFNDMAIFAKVVQLGSFTAAGRALSLPKSNISRRIARLEETLKVRLLERTTRKLHLTEIGQSYFHHAQRVVEEAEIANSLVESMMAGPRGILRISTSVYTGQHLVAPLLPEFLKKYPDIRLQIELSNRRVDLIEEGIDVAIRIGSLEDSGMMSRHLGRSRLYLYCSPDYKNSFGTPTLPHDLIDHRLLLMSDMSIQNKFIIKGPRGEETLLLKPYCSINDFHTLHHLAITDLGIAALPESLCRKDLKPIRIDTIRAAVVFNPLFKKPGDTIGTIVDYRGKLKNRSGGKRLDVARLV